MTFRSYLTLNLSCSRNTWNEMAKKITYLRLFCFPFNSSLDLFILPMHLLPSEWVFSFQCRRCRIWRRMPTDAWESRRSRLWPRDAPVATLGGPLGQGPLLVCGEEAVTMQWWGTITVISIFSRATRSAPSFSFGLETRPTALVASGRDRQIYWQSYFRVPWLKQHSVFL